MDGRLVDINRTLKAYNSRLFAQRRNDGCILVWRKPEPWQKAIIDEDTIVCPGNQIIFALTHNWTLNGTPVDWGLLPIYFKAADCDANRDDSYYDKMVNDRLKEKELRERARSNEHKAIAADERRTFARAFNDINTSTLEKIDNRRVKDNAYH